MAATSQEKKKYIAVINKIDYKETSENIPEFYKLGIKKFIQIAAEHNRNVAIIGEYIDNNFNNLKLAICEDSFGFKAPLF